MAARSFGSRSCAAMLVIPFALGTGACKKDEPAAEVAAEPATERPPEPSPKTKAKPGRALPPVSYPVELDPLLDLVPADAKEFAVVRDPKPLVDLASTYMAAYRAPLEKMGKAGMGGPVDAADQAKFATMVENLASIRAKIDASGIDLSKGLVAASLDDQHGIVIYAASKPDALAELVKLFSDPEDLQPLHCGPLAAVPGYVACTSGDEAMLQSYAPGKQAKALRLNFGEMDLDRANVAVLTTSDGPIPLTLETSEGRFALDVAMSAAAGQNLGPMLSPIDPELLGLATPESAFAWVSTSPTGLQTLQKSTPMMAAGVVASLSGEFVVGGIGGIDALTVAARVKDPGPGAGLVAMLESQIPSLPKELPDGSALAVEAKTVETPSGPIKAVHAKVTPKAKNELFSALPWKSEGVMFSGGNLLAAVVGQGDTAIAPLVSTKLEGPSEAFLSAVDPAFANALERGKASMALRMPLDGLQTKAARELFVSIVKLAVMQSAGAPPDAAEIAAGSSLASTAPFSQLDAWLTHDGNLHLHAVATGLLGLPEAERIAVEEVLGKVANGGDGKALYQELATRFASSPRAANYRTRAGDDVSMAIPAMMILGGIATGVLAFGSGEAVAAEPTEAPPAVPAPPPVAVPE